MSWPHSGLICLLLIMNLGCARHIAYDFDRLTHYQRQQDFNYELTTTDGDRVSIHCDEFSWEEIALRQKKARIPGFYFQCKRKVSPNPRKLAIWIHGGPWASAGTDLVVEQLAFLDSGYDIFIPFYPGSSDRPFELIGFSMKSDISDTLTELASTPGTTSVGMKPDVVDALSELKSAYNWGKRNYAVVDVVGESFGAFLSASMIPHLKNESSLFLINPNLSGEVFLENLYASMGKELALNGKNAASNPDAAKQLNKAYFQRLKGYDPIELINQPRKIKVKLVYGGADELLVAGEIKAIKALVSKKCGIEYRPDNGHEFGYTRQHFEATRRLIRC